MSNYKYMKDERLSEIIESSRDQGDIKVLREAVNEGLKRGLVKNCEKCRCQLLEKDFDAHKCIEDGNFNE